MATLRHGRVFGSSTRPLVTQPRIEFDLMRSNLGVQSPPLPLFTDLRDFRAAAPHGRRTERRDRNAGQHNDISHPLATLRLYFCRRGGRPYLVIQVPAPFTATTGEQKNEGSVMSHTKEAARRKRRTKAVPVLGAAGLSLSLASGASRRNRRHESADRSGCIGAGRPSK